MRAYIEQQCAAEISIFILFHLIFIFVTFLYLWRNVHPDTQWVKAADACYNSLCGYMEILNSDEKVNWLMWLDIFRLFPLGICSHRRRV